MKVVFFISLVICILFAINAAHAEWYYDVIMDGDIRSAYFAGWKGLDCIYIHASALKNIKVPQDYRASHAEFLEQTCIKGKNDNRESKGDRQFAEKEILSLEKLFVDRIPMLKAK